jgi:hypothetical protein
MNYQSLAIESRYGVLKLIAGPLSTSFYRQAVFLNTSLHTLCRITSARKYTGRCCLRRFGQVQLRQRAACLWENNGSRASQSIPSDRSPNPSVAFVALWGTTPFLLLQRPFLIRSMPGSNSGTGLLRLHHCLSIDSYMITLRWGAVKAGLLTIQMTWKFFAIELFSTTRRIKHLLSLAFCTVEVEQGAERER